MKVSPPLTGKRDIQNRHARFTLTREMMTVLRLNDHQMPSLQIYCFSIEVVGTNS